MRKGPGSVYDKWNISLVVCDRYCHCVVCSSIYGFWLPLWYLQTLLTVAIFFISEYFKLEWYNNQISTKSILSHLLYPYKARLVTGSQGSTPYISRWRIGMLTTCHFENIWRKSKSCGHAHLHYVYKHSKKYYSCSSKTVGGDSRTIMEVCMSTGFWFSSNILKMTALSGSWTLSFFSY
jgi:hypothetical protein